MQNSVMASIEFDYRGESIEAVAAIDIDLCLRHGEPLEYVYHEIAAQSGIGSHTYQYDMMVMQPVHFFNPTGIAANHLHDGELDFDGLLTAWKEKRIADTLQPIARRHLGIERLDEHPEIKAALIEAYLAD